MPRLFALGLKKWVEVRSARVPPKARITKAKVLIPDDFGLHTYWVRQVRFDGGRYVTSIRKRKFSSLTALKVPLHGVVEIPAAFHADLRRLHE